MSFSATVKRAWNQNRLMSVMLELTYACNLDCTFCYNDLSLDGQRLTLAQYRTLLDDLAEMGVLNLTLTGGEPLAHPNFFEIARYARSLGFVIRIKTNGHAVKEAVARRIRDEIDPFLVEVSIHGATAETHDRQTRVPGSFRRLLSNISAMKTVGLRVKVNSVLTRWNEGEVEAMLLLFDRLDVQFQIDPEVKPRDDGDRSPLSIEASTDGQARYRRALAARADATEAFSSPAPEQRAIRSGTDKHCGAGSNNLAIDPYGRVLPCVQWRVPVGDLHEQPLHAIWNAPAALEGIRETTRAVREKLEGLGNAELTMRFCPGAAYTHSGDPLAVYPPVAKPAEESGRTPVRLTVL